MNFAHKNFDSLIKEGALNKFDNVTFKTIHHEHKINPGDMEKFLANFDDVGKVVGLCWKVCGIVVGNSHFFPIINYPIKGNSPL